MMALLLIANNSYAVTLSNIFKDTLNFDSSITAADKTVSLRKLERLTTISAALPSIQLSATQNKSEIELATGTTYNNKPFVNTEAVTWTLSTADLFRIGAASERINSEELNAANTTQQTLLSAFNLYIQIITNYEIYLSEAAQISYLTTIYKQEKQKLEAGASTLTNVSLAKANLDKAIANKIKMQLNITTALNSLRAISGKKYMFIPRLPQNVNLSNKLKLKSLPFYQEKALQENLAINQKRKTLGVKIQQYRESQSTLLPSIILEAAHTNYNNDDNAAPTSIESSTIYSAGLKYTFGGGKVSQIMSSRKEVQIEEALLTNSTEQLITNTANFYATVRSKGKAIKKYEQTVISAKISLDASKASLDAGAATITDVLDSLQDLQQSQSQLARSRYDFLNAYINLELTAGTNLLDVIGKIDRITHYQADVSPF